MSLQYFYGFQVIDEPGSTLFLTVVVQKLYNDGKNIKKALLKINQNKISNISFCGI